MSNRRANRKLAAAALVNATEQARLLAAAQRTIDKYNKYDV